MSDLSFQNLRQFVDHLKREGELQTVDVSVDPNLEVAEIHRRVIAAGGPALLFTNVQGAKFPLVTNLFGTPRRAAWAFGTRPKSLIERIAKLPEEMIPPTPSKLWANKDLGLDLLRIGMTRKRRGPVTEVVNHSPNLETLPLIKSWEEDGGAFVTLPLVYTEHPEKKIPNLGMYRMHRHDATSTGMHWQIGKGGGFHYQLAEQKNEALPVTVFLGGPPALILSAIAPLPENVPELMLASLIAGKKLPLVEGVGAHPLVAEAEFALMGKVEPHRRKPEGPFGDHYGYYSLQHDYPVFELSKIAHRKDAIYPATVVGKPRQEDFFIGDLLQELLSPLFPLVMPGVLDLWSYGETGYHSLAAAVVRERYTKEAMASAFRILGEGQLSLTKFLLVLDKPQDLTNFKAVFEYLLERTHPETDLYVLPNLSMDTLDYSGPKVNHGSKGIWLGLGEPVRKLPRSFNPPCELPSDVSEVEVYCGGCLVISGPSLEESPDAASRYAAHPAFSEWPLLVVHDQAKRTAHSDMNFLWSTFTRFDPATDIYASKTETSFNQILRQPPIAIDARVPSSFPKELFCDEETEKLVDRRWKEYFPSGQTMGDARQGHLDPV